MNLSKENARVLQDLLGRNGALAEALGEVREEFESRASMLINLDLESPEEAPKARKLQGEIRGGLQVLDRIEELINERSNQQLGS